MARKQMSIPGTERKEIPDVERAAEELRDINAEHKELGKKKTQKKHELLAVMRANKLKLYRYHDEDGEEIEIEIDDDPKVVIHKTGEAEPEIGEGVSSGEDLTPKAGLMAQAAAAMADSNVEESPDGDVVVPDAAQPKAKTKRKAKR